ncbi:MAG: hypothetical protein RBS56_02720 [Candidatus Gracilibacteria bacterium]|jgi:hypothetical protein|nr:hypothetical protein [Candidatus Gracilibacteria bacterium]
MEKLTKHILKAYLIITILLACFSQIGFSATVDELLPPPSQGESTITGGYEQIENVRNLPDVSIEGAAATVIKTVLGWSFIIALAGIVLAGIYMLAFEGDTSKVDKAKNILYYLIIGEIIVSIAYGIVNGIIQFKFF